MVNQQELAVIKRFRINLESRFQDFKRNRPEEEYIWNDAIFALWQEYGKFLKEFDEYDKDQDKLFNGGVKK